MREKVFSLVLILMLCLVPLLTGKAMAKPFYEGKTIKIIVGFKPGGGTDFYGRLLARGMMKYLPGCRIVVKNIPGASSIIALNTIYASKPDGLTFGAFNRALVTSQLVGLKGIKYDMQKVTWLGSPSSETYGLYVSPKKYNSLEEVLKADNIRMATTGYGANNYLTGLLFFRMMNFDNFTMGTGYSGNELSLVILRGEMDALFGSYATQQAVINSGDLKPLLFISDSKPEGWEQIPYIQDIVTDKKHQPTLDFLLGLNKVGRPFVGPPGIPQDRLNILRKAFRQAIEDPDSKKLAQKANKPLLYISPAEAEKWVDGIFNLPPDIIALLKEAYGVK